MRKLRSNPNAFGSSFPSWTQGLRSCSRGPQPALPAQPPFLPRCHAPATPAVQESPALARLASVGIFVQATSASTECLPQPLCLFQTCASLQAQLREAETGGGEKTSEAFPDGPGPCGLSSLSSQVSEGQLTSVDTDHPHPPRLTTVVTTTPCTALAVSTSTASA